MPDNPQHPEHPQDADLDLIAMVQRARMLHDQAATPSNLAAVYWIEAKAAAAQASPTARAGEWVAQVPAAQVDALWAKVKAATEAGTLGYKSKVSTAAHSDRTTQAHADTRTLCARTYDADDSADRERVRAALERLGVPGPLVYRRDQS